MKKRIRDLIVMAGAFYVLFLLTRVFFRPPRTITYHISHSPNFYGIVQSTEDEYYVIAVREDDEVYEEYPVVYVSKDIINGDSDRYFDDGEDVNVYYDGNIVDGKVEVVYAILLCHGANYRFGFRFGL